MPCIFQSRVKRIFVISCALAPEIEQSELSSKVTNNRLSDMVTPVESRVFSPSQIHLCDAPIR